ncbi:NAD(P)-dependent oxidoreductase [bacterium]|nr:MAG: NAD(P)-dependent oxidoreductase [bacterium]
MKIALYGATGNLGQRILREALERGHEVTAIVRDPARLDVANERLTVVTGNITDAASVAQDVRGHDAVIGSISGRRDGNADHIIVAAETVLKALPESGVKRLVWVGGAGSLEVAPGVKLIDIPEFPEEYKVEASTQVTTLEMFRAVSADEVEWSFFSPAAVIAPGERTGKFRLGGDQLVTDAEGNSHISIEDFAVALIDEVEKPHHIGQRFTIGY